MTIISNGQRVPIATIRAHIGKRVRWQQRDHTIRGYVFDGRQGGGILSEVMGQNLCIGGDWLWRPDLKTLETIELSPQETARPKAEQ